MQLCDNTYDEILTLLVEKRRFDPSQYYERFVMNRIKNRVARTKCMHANEYVNFIHQHPDELDKFVDALTINVSRFFREALVFSYIESILLPQRN